MKSSLCDGTVELAGNILLGQRAVSSTLGIPKGKFMPDDLLLSSPVAEIRGAGSAASQVVSGISHSVMLNRDIVPRFQARRMYWARRAHGAPNEAQTGSCHHGV